MRTLRSSILRIFLSALIWSTVEMAGTEPTAQQLREADLELAKIKKEKPAEYRKSVGLVQMALGAFGFGTGPFDGALDPKTRLALRRYQKVRGLAQTGDLDGRT